MGHLKLSLLFCYYQHKRGERKVVTMIQKQEIILRHFRDGQSQRQISRDLGISRGTVTTYLQEYAEQKRQLAESSTQEDTDALLASVADAPTYNSSTRLPRKLSDAIIARVRELLAENAKKRSRGQHKQQMKKCDLHAQLQAEGYDIGYTSVCGLVNRLEGHVPESFIRQAYEDGTVCEFDWGDVKLFLAGQLQTVQLGIFTSAQGNYRYAQLFMRQDTAAFQQAHALFFEHLGGVYREVVYDNMRVVVKRFVGPNEKEPTHGLLSLSAYYQFRFRFCNVRRGNEKGHVERSVEYVRRKAFCRHDSFAHLDEANAYLVEVCSQLNALPQAEADGQSAQMILERERAALLPVGPRFECGELRELRVDAWSTIQVETCRYSVPEQYVGQRMQVRIYPERLVCYAAGQRVCQHRRRYGRREWSMTLAHYLTTLSRKPGALSGSVALQQIDPRVHALYEAHYAERPKAFIEVLRYMQQAEKPVQEIESVVRELCQTGVREVTVAMIKAVCERAHEPTRVHPPSGIERAASAQLRQLAGLVPNQATLHGGPIV
jgi:transposase